MSTAKRDAALAMMARTGIMESNYYPPVLRLIGLSLAAYCAYGRRKHQLPLWHELPGN